MLFARCFEAWVASVWPDQHDFIAIDGAKNMAVVRRFPLNLVRNHKSKGSVKTRRKPAGWSPEFLLSVLQVNAR